ncbi:MAG: hypothetical protein ABIL58_14095 [Pseudomonadota bacterium]
MIHIGIVGARKYQDRQSVIDLINTLPRGAVIITSSCRGVCTWAGEAAKATGFEVRLYSPDLTGIQSHADMVERYYRRNRQLIAACHIVHAFISKEDGLTGGTRYEVHYAKRLGKEIVLHWEGGKVERIQRQASLFGAPEADFSAGWMKFFTEALG